MLVVGLDGASWKILDPLMEGGYVPTLERLVSSGVKADLDCEPAYPPQSCFCPPVWQSIVTGQPATVHRVFNFGTPSTNRRSPTLWDVVHEYGGKSTLVDLHNTWPADPSAEIVVTEPGVEIFTGVLYESSSSLDSGPIFDQPDTWTKPSDLFEQLGFHEDERGGHAWFPMAKDRVSMTFLERLAALKRDTPMFALSLIHISEPTRPY